MQRTHDCAWLLSLTALAVLGVVGALPLLSMVNYGFLMAMTCLSLLSGAARSNSSATPSPVALRCGSRSARRSLVARAPNSGLHW